MSFGDIASVVAAVGSTIAAGMSLYQYFKEKREREQQRNPSR